MYQLNRKTIKGLIIAGSLMTILPMMHTQSSNQKSKISIPQPQQETNDEVFGPYLNQTVTSEDLNGCIVYKKYTSKKIDGEWTEWEEDPILYVGTRNELDEYQETDSIKIKKETLGFIENGYTEEDFIAIKRTYHEEVYEDEWVNERWKGNWKVVGEPLVLMNSKTLPARCLSRWVLDNVEVERITPIVSETELYQKYDLVIKDGDFTYEPTLSYTTVTNIPDSDYKFVKVGEYQTSENIEKQISQGATLYKTL